MCNGLTEAGATLKYVYDPDPVKVAAFCQAFPQVQPAERLETILDDPEVQLVAAAAITAQRGQLGVRVMHAGKDYFTDKAPFTTLEQLEAARAAVKATGRKYAVYYSERLHVECAVHAGRLVQDGVIGRVIQVLGLGPHRLNAAQRPAWFFDKQQYGGILTDIGSHQIEQFLFYSGAQDATVQAARVANHAHPQYPELEDYGEATLLAANGASGFLRVDWFTPDGLRTWGDGRLFILGEKGYIELRKYIDVGRGLDHAGRADADRTAQGNQLYLVTDEGETHLSLSGQVGYPFFGELILDCLQRTEHAMTQEHAFREAQLCLEAQLLADRSSRSRTDQPV
jgi:predicted dehydrogenase